MRRRVLAIAAGVLATALLAACSSGSDAGDPTTFAAPSYSTATVDPQPLRAPEVRQMVFGESPSTLIEYLQRHTYLIYEAIGAAGHADGRIGLALDRRGVGSEGFPIVGIQAAAGLRVVILVACDTPASRPRTVTATLGVDGRSGGAHSVLCGRGVGTSVFYLGPDQRPTSLRIDGPAGLRFAVTGIALVV